MANIKSQKKRILTNEKARIRNKAVRSELKTATRHVEDAVAAGDAQATYAAALAACRLFDKAASKGVIHKNQAANRKSGIMKLANTVPGLTEISGKPTVAVASKAKPAAKKAAAKKAVAKKAEKAEKAAE